MYAVRESHGFNGVDNTITHVTLPNGYSIKELEDKKVSGFEECEAIVKMLNEAYQQGVKSEGERFADFIDKTRLRG